MIGMNKPQVRSLFALTQREDVKRLLDDDSAHIHLSQLKSGVLSVGYAGNTRRWFAYIDPDGKIHQEPRA